MGGRKFNVDRSPSTVSFPRRRESRAGFTAVRWSCLDSHLRGNDNVETGKLVEGPNLTAGMAGLNPATQ